mgnify:CR=1 FL=1
MKRKAFLLLALVALIAMESEAQQNQETYLHTWEGRERTHTIGFYAGLYGSYAEICHEPSYWLGYRAGLVINSNWGFGLAGYAMNFDRKLTGLVTEGTYHLLGGYQGMYAEFIQPIGNRARVNFSLLYGRGIVYYQYDRDFREVHGLENGIIDKDHYMVLEPGIELQFRLAGKCWFGLHSSLRTTSPVKLIGVDSDFMEEFTTGISIKYGIF